jgi:hypothetical protein
MEPSAPELELQKELQRFATLFGDRITQATETLERVPRADVRDAALKKCLLYATSALEIATGSTSEINLLDMFVFIRLCRAAVDKHWVPTLYGEAGRELAEAFARSDEEITSIAGRTLGPARTTQLTELVDRWLAENPGQTRVESIRLTDFAAAAGAAAADRALQVRGLLSSVRTATRAANEAMQLADRALFMFHRLPSLWRLQARVGAREVLGDSVTHLTRGPQSPVGQLTARVRSVAMIGAVFAGVLGGGALLLWARGRRRD